MNASSLLGALTGMAVVAGVLLAVAGLRKSVPPADADGPHRGPTAGKKFFRTTTRTVLIGAGVGIVVWLLTGYLIAVVITPLALLIVPTLIVASPGGHVIERLAGMESWTRSLTGVLDVGVGLEEAIVSASLRATPPAIDKEVRLLVARVRARSDLPTALRAFADDLDDSTGDIIVATLLTGATQRGRGLITVLEALADNVSDEVRIRRTVEAERAPRRTVARTVTIAAVGFLTAEFLFTDFLNAYSSPVGQIILGFYLVLFLLALLWIQSIGKTKPLPRFIGDHLRTRPRRPMGATR